MAFRTKKISQMDPKGAPLASTDLLEISELVSGSYVTKSITGQEIIDSVPPATVDWGDIGGTLSAQTDLQTALDGKVDENTAITGATKTKITYDSKGLVTAGADATTADIADSLNKRYVTDANLTTLSNTSGVNTGDQTLSGLGGVPTTRTLTINGTTQDLSADRTFTISTGITIGTTAITSGTVGRVLFEGTGNIVSESANLFFDVTNSTFQIKNTTGGIPTPSISLTTNTFTSQIIAGNATYPYALGANSLNIYHSVSGPIGFYNGGASPSLRLNILSDGKVIIGSATSATSQFTVNSSVNGSGIQLVNSTNPNTSYTIVHTAPSANNWSFNSASTGSTQSAGTLSIGSTTNNMLLFSNGNTVFGGIGSVDAGYKLDVNGTARVQNLLQVSQTITAQGATNFPSSGSGVYMYYNNNGGNLASTSNFSTGATQQLCIQPAGGKVAINTGGEAFTNTNNNLRQKGGAEFALNGTTQSFDFYVNALTGNVDFNLIRPANGLNYGHSLLFKAYDSINATVIYSGIGNQINANTTGGHSGSLLMYTASAGTTAERMRIASTGNVLINTTTDVASSKLTIESTTQGFLPPRMTTTQKNAIATPATGLMVYDTTLNLISVYNGTSWITL